MIFYSGSTDSVCGDNPYAGVDSLCRASFPTYYYDKGRNVCIQFTYGGCLASRNIFGSLEDCEQTCAI